MAKKNKKQALGRGLSTLLDDPEREISSASDVNADKVVGNIIDLEIDKIEINPTNRGLTSMNRPLRNWQNPSKPLELSNL